MSTDMRSRVEACIDVIRPALQADKGDIELVDVDETTGVVTVRLVGACGTCPVSTQTLKGGIERIMRDRVDGVTAVVDVATLDEAALGAATLGDGDRDLDGDRNLDGVEVGSIV